MKNARIHIKYAREKLKNPEGEMKYVSVKSFLWFLISVTEESQDEIDRLDFVYWAAAIFYRAQVAPLDFVDIRNKQLLQDLETALEWWKE